MAIKLSACCAILGLTFISATGGWVADEATSASFDRSSNTNKDSQKAKLCRDMASREAIELCANWQSSQASVESARWAGRSFYLSLIVAAFGALTLGAAVAAAWFAKRAAEETKRSADAAHDSNRPWLDVEVAMDSDGSLSWHDENIELPLHIKVWNYGNSPATNVYIEAEGYCSQQTAKRRITELRSSRSHYGEGIYSKTVFPSDEPTIDNFAIEVDRFDNPTAEEALGRAEITLLVFVRYQTITQESPDRHHLTVRVYSIRDKRAHGIEKALCPIRAFNVGLETSWNIAGVIT